MEDVEKPISYYEAGLDAINNSKNLKNLLADLLRIGNYVNGGTSRGDCYGFKFEFLEKVKETKTREQGINLTNFIAEFFPVDDLYNDLSCLKEAVSTDIDTAKISFNKLKDAFIEFKGCNAGGKVASFGESTR